MPRVLDLRRLTPHDEYYFWYRAALVHLISGDHNGYRAVCAGMLRHFGGADATGDPADFSAWTCALGPGALDDYTAAVALAERLLSERPKDPKVAMNLGAVLYRAGRYSEAVAELDTAGRLPEDPRTSPIYGWLFLAMAHHRLGHAAEANTWLDKPSPRSSRPLPVRPGAPASGPPWFRRLTLDLLRQEAEALVRSGDRSGMPNGAAAFAR